MSALAWLSPQRNPTRAPGASRDVVQGLLQRARLARPSLPRIPPRIAVVAGACGVLGAGIAVALQPVLTAPIGLGTTLLTLRGSAIRAAEADAIAEPGDPIGVILMLAEDPALRASRAVYEAALQRPGARPFKPQRSHDTHSHIVAAMHEVDAIYAARAPSTAPAPPRLPRLYARTARTARTRAVAAPQHIGQVIYDAAARVGVDANFLTRTAARESSFNPYAAAHSSSARGLFQFIKQTWLISVARWGHRHGLAREAALIRVDPSGRAYVRDPSAERAILSLRYDPVFSSRIAAEFSAANARELAARFRRLPSGGELYAAHLLGVGGAVQLVETAATRPNYPAAWLLPKAAASNRTLFYRNGRPSTVAELLRSLS